MTAPTLDTLLQAYIDCRQHKRNTTSAREFEQHLERNLCDLHAELLDGSYRPGRSHKERAAVCRALLKRGHAVDGLHLAKTFRSNAV